MASTRQCFAWGWGRLPRSGLDSLRPDPAASSVSASPSARKLSATGSASSTSTSTPSPAITRLPRLLEALETSTSLRSISAAQHHVVAVTNSGEAYTWGALGPAVIEDDEERADAEERNKDDASKAKQGRELRAEDSLRFRQIYGCDGVYQVAVLSSSMYAITAASDCFGWRWGSDEDGWTDNSLVPQRSLLPYPLPVLTAMQCTSIACGTNFALFLTSSGLLYTLGQPSHSPPLSASSSPPQPQLVPLEPLLLTRISAGFAHAAAITHTGQLLTWGCSLHGRLGNGRMQGEDVTRPMPVGGGFDAAVVDVACGYAHTLALDVEGRVWSMGSNARGQCGWGEEEPGSNTVASMCAHPVLVEGLNEQIVAISAGAFHSAAITALSELLVWGWNKQGQLGIGGDDEHQPVPTPVAALSGMDVRLVSCAADYTVAVTDHFMSIEPNYFVEQQRAGDALHRSFSSNTDAKDEDEEEKEIAAPAPVNASVIPRSVSATPLSPTPDTPAPVVFDESEAVRPAKVEEPEPRPRTQSSSPIRVKRKSTVTRAPSPAVQADGERSLLSLVKEALLISPLPDSMPDDLGALPSASSMSPPSSPRSPTQSSSVPSSSSSSFASFSSSLVRRVSSTKKVAALAAQQSSAFNAMTSAYLNKLQRSAKEAAASRLEQERAAHREQRQRAEETRRSAKREKAMEEAASEWTKTILPRWSEPKIRARAREMVARTGIPTKIRGQVWPVAIGNALMITAELYKIFSERANKFKAKKKRDKLTTLSPSTPPEVEGPSDASGSSNNSHELNDSALADLKAFGKADTISYIDTDLARTFPQLAFFQEECAMHEQLRSILYTYCFAEFDTRILTNHGLLFLDQIEALQREDCEVLFGCYEEQSKRLLYSKGKLVFPKRPPPYLVEFTSAGEAARWAEGSGDYGVEGVPEDNERSRHVSLRVTPDHDMYVQLGNGSSKGSTVHWSSTRPWDPATKTQGKCVVKPHSKVQARDLLSDDPREYVRMLACAQAGYAPQSTTQRRTVQRDLHLDDTQFAAFIELLGFWIGDGSMAYNPAVNGSARGYVRFSQVKKDDLSWLRRMFKKAGLRQEKHWLTDSSRRQMTLYIKEPAWFAFFDKEFGRKYQGSQYYSLAAATPPSTTRSLRSSSSSSASPTPPSTTRRISSSSFSIDLTSSISTTFTFTPRGRSISAVSTVSMTDAIAAECEDEDKDDEDDQAVVFHQEDEEDEKEEADGSAAVPIDLSDDDVKLDDAGAVIPPPNQPTDDEDEPLKTEPPVDEESADSDEEMLPLPDEEDEEEEEPLPLPRRMPPGWGITWGPNVQPEPVKSVKHLPTWTLQELSAAEMRLLISGLHRADGSFAGAQNVIFTSSARFRDQLMQALLHCGYCAYAGLDYRKGTVRGFQWHDQTVHPKPYSVKFVADLSKKEQRNYRAIVATADAWKVRWSQVVDSRNMSSPAGNCWPSMPRQQCVTTVRYDAARDGRTWCVEVEHKNQLIIAQRAQRVPDGTVTKQSRPIVVGNCFYRPDVGYVQGVSYLAANFLLYMPPFKSFVCFANLLNSAFFHAFLKMDAQLTEMRYRLFLDLLHDHAPQLSFHLTSQGVTPDLYLLEWCMTLFCKRLKLDVVGRVWDLFIMEGETAVYRVAVAVLVCMNEGGRMMQEDMGQLLKRLAKEGLELEEERLMHEVSKVQLSDKLTQRLQQIIELHTLKDEDIPIE